MAAHLSSTLLILVMAATACACSSSGATVLIESTEATRAPDGHVVVDVVAVGVEHAGGPVGNYCVGVHWFAPGRNLSLIKPVAAYVGELDFVEQCASDLEDGDERTFHVVSKSASLPPGAVYRAQGRVGGSFASEDGISP